MVGAGGSLLWDATGWDGEALKGSLEQEDAFLMERASKKKKKQQMNIKLHKRTKQTAAAENRMPKA